MKTFITRVSALNNLITRVSVVLLVIALSSCNKFWDYAESTSYIVSYFELSDDLSLVATQESDPTTLVLTIKNEDSFFLYDDFLCSAVSLRGLNPRGGFSETQQQRILYDNLCSQYGDIYYPSRSIGPSFNPISTDLPRAIANEIREVLITSDKKWDENHPAGTSLNDLFEIKYASHYPFVNSDYDKEYEIAGGSTLSENSYTKKPLKDLSNKDLVLLDASSTIRFYAKKTILESGYKLTITLKINNGEDRVLEISL